MVVDVLGGHAAERSAFLRTLDAIHLATALLVAGDEQLAMVSLDRRLRRAAAAEGLVVLPEVA